MLVIGSAIFWQNDNALSPELLFSVKVAVKQYKITNPYKNK